jgi:methionyl-tRNA formyltransferase
MHDNTKPKIVFLGSDLNPISVGSLKVLSAGDRYDILVGVDQHDESAWQLINLTWRRHGLQGVFSRIAMLLVARFQRVVRRVTGSRMGGSLSEVASLGQMETFRCADVNGSEVRQIIQSFAPDLIVVANFSQIIRAKIRSLPKLGVINFHPSLLPKYRGPMPCYWIIRNRETRSGATVHFIDDGIDTGDIIMQREIPVFPDDTEPKLITRSIELGAPLLDSSVRSLLAGTAVRRNQLESEATYYGFPRGRNG